MTESINDLLNSFEEMDSWEFSRETFMNAVLNNLGEQGLIMQDDVLLRMMEIASHHSVEYSRDLDSMYS